MDAAALKNEFENALRETRQLCDEDVPLDERKHRLNVRRDLNKLYRLYDVLLAVELDATDDGGESEILAAIREHLEPLGLAPEGTELPELARLAALKIMER